MNCPTTKHLFVGTDIKKMFEAQYIEYDVTQSLVDEIKEYMNDKKLKKI